MDGAAIRRSVSFSAIAHHEAKFSMSVTRGNDIIKIDVVFPND